MNFTALLLAWGPLLSAPSAPGDPEAVVNQILPCGLRVIVGRDSSLPVAAIILAVGVGSADDPPELPGLVRALAMQLQLGNRELAPGAAASTVHDSGGVTDVVVGTSQTRFESLVPLTELERVLATETSRLRAPTVNQTTWKSTVRQLARMKPKRGSLSESSARAAWGLPVPDPASTSVQSMVDGAISVRMASMFDYSRATLSVTSPDPPQQVLEKVAKLVADLPDLAHIDLKAIPMPTYPGEPGPRVLRDSAARQLRLVWAIPGDPSARVAARIACVALMGASPSGTRIDCSLHDDNHRPLVVVSLDRKHGPEIVALAWTKAEARLEDARNAVMLTLARELDSALPLARALAGAADLRSSELLADYTGMNMLDEEPLKYVPTLFQLDAALLIEPAKAAKTK